MAVPEGMRALSYDDADAVVEVYPPACRASPGLPGGQTGPRAGGRDDDF